MPSKTKESIWVTFFIILGCVTFIILFLGLRGSLTGRRTYINVIFNDVGGLRIGDPVYIRGVSVGTVKKIALHDEQVIVKIGIDPGLRIPKDSKCYLNILSYFSGDMCVKIDAGTGPIATFNDTLRGESNIMNIETMLNSLAEGLKGLNLDSLGSQIGKIGRLLVRDIQKSLKDSFTPLSSSLDRVMVLTERIDSLFNVINKKEGTVAKLINSDELYKEIIATNKELRSLIEDIKANPKRYFKIEVF